MVEDYTNASQAVRALDEASDAPLKSQLGNFENDGGDLCGLFGENVLPYMGDDWLRRVAATLPSDLTRCHVSSVFASKSRVCEGIAGAHSPPPSFATTETGDNECPTLKGVCTTPSVGSGCRTEKVNLSILEC